MLIRCCSKVATGAYDLHPEQTSSNEIIASALSSVGSGSGTEDSKNSRSVVADGNDGNEEIDWLPGWHHHIVALTAFMPVAHAVFFLHRFRLNYPNWARNHPWFPGINGWLRGPLQEVTVVEISSKAAHALLFFFLFLLLFIFTSSLVLYILTFVTCTVNLVVERIEGLFGYGGRHSHSCACIWLCWKDYSMVSVFKGRSWQPHRWHGCGRRALA
eukprot:SAG31_NODE_176_length_21334_cov_12.211067_17_plen_215_part_00